MISSTIAKVVAACRSCLRHMSKTCDGAYGWNAVSVCSSRFVFDDDDIWVDSVFCIGKMCCMSLPFCSCLYAVGRPYLYAIRFRACSACLISGTWSKDMGVAGISPMSTPLNSIQLMVISL